MSLTSATRYRTPPSKFSSLGIEEAVAAEKRDYRHGGAPSWAAGARLVSQSPGGAVLVLFPMMQTLSAHFDRLARHWWGMTYTLGPFATARKAAADYMAKAGSSGPLISLSVAVVLHADDRGRVAAPLASERQVSDEGMPGDSRTAKQEQPGNIGDAPAPRADGSQMGVALRLGLRD